MTDESMLAGGEMEIITATPAPVRFPSSDRIFTRPPVVRGGAVTGSDYMLASYERGSNTGRTLSANAPSETAPGTDASASAPMNVYRYAGDQIIENVTMGYFYYQDSLGNTSHVTDAVGNLLERYTYSAFGTPTFYNAGGTQIAVSTYGIRHLFQGQLWTQETGLNDYRNRVELPVMGVFLQPDPIGFRGDPGNLYRYCGNDPMNRSDPMGLYAQGYGWTKENWEKYQSSQEKAANATGGAADRIESALKTGGKELSALKKDFERVYGPGSATEKNLRQVDTTLRGMETALRDNGQLGYYANAVTMKETLSNNLSKDTAAFTRPSDRHSMYVNVDHANFGKSTLVGSVIHESSHNLGLIDVKFRGVTANRHGTLTDQAYFKQLPFREPDKALQNAETLTSFVVP